MNELVKSTVIEEIGKIHHALESIERILAGMDVIPPAPTQKPIVLSNPSLISRALRGGKNDFYPDGSMRITYPVNEAEGGVAVPVNYSKRVAAGFELLFEHGFDFPYGLKIFRISSFNEKMGLNDWDVIMVAIGDPKKGRPAAMLSVEAARNGGAWWGEAPLKLDLDAWHKFVIRMDKGEIGKPKSGSLVVDINGNRVLNLSSVEVIRGDNHFADGPIDRLHFGGWYSNSAHGNPKPHPTTPAVCRIRNAWHSGE